tara:strand:+ start:5273 stop:5746 length:474 start_codon:yes stop_codon:yes gene_type:complete
MSKIKKIGIVIGVLVVISFFVGEPSSDSKSSKSSKTTTQVKEAAKDKIEQEAYFKAPNKYRIYTFSFESNVTEEQIRKHASRQSHTSGKLTSCYYFPVGASIPRDGISSAVNLFKANEVINNFADGIDYVYLKGQNGVVTFVNCIENPTDDLCVNNN